MRNPQEYARQKVAWLLFDPAIVKACVRISQQSDELGTVSASEAHRIICEEVDKSLKVWQ